MLLACPLFGKIALFGISIGRIDEDMREVFQSPVIRAA